MQCPFCNKTVAKKDAYCRHCGKEIPIEAKFPPPPPLWHTETKYSEEERGEVLSRVYHLLLGDDYMQMIARLHPLNPDRAIAMMRDDLGVCFGKRPKKTTEEIDAELADFFNDPVTRQNMDKSTREGATDG